MTSIAQGTRKNARELVDCVNVQINGLNLQNMPKNTVFWKNIRKGERKSISNIAGKLVENAEASIFSLSLFFCL